MVKKFFQRLFGKGKREEAPAPPVEEVESSVGTAPFREEDLLTLQEEMDRLPVRPLQVQVGVALDAGLQRDHNEDAVLAQSLVLASRDQDVLVGLYVVADGMGGHLHGEQASDVAVRTLVQHLTRHLFAPLSHPEQGMPDQPLLDLMEAAVQEANRAVLRYAAGGGSTLTAALLVGQQLILGHVGDSRAYFIHPDRRMQVLTRDHSLVKRLEELQQLTPEEAAHHPQRNVLYRALGQSEPLQPEVKSERLPRAGYLLLCSDGLWGVVPEEEIVAIVFQAVSPQEACRELVRAAHRHGAPDNISAVLVHFA